MSRPLRNTQALSRGPTSPFAATSCERDSAFVSEPVKRCNSALDTSAELNPRHRTRHCIAFHANARALPPLLPGSSKCEDDRGWQRFDEFLSRYVSGANHHRRDARTVANSNYRNRVRLRRQVGKLHEPVVLSARRPGNLLGAQIDRGIGHGSSRNRITHDNRYRCAILCDGGRRPKQRGQQQAHDRRHDSPD